MRPQIGDRVYRVKPYEVFSKFYPDYEARTSRAGVVTGTWYGDEALSDAVSVKWDEPGDQISNIAIKCLVPEAPTKKELQQTYQSLKTSQ